MKEISMTICENEELENINGGNVFSDIGEGLDIASGIAGIGLGIATADPIAIAGGVAGVIGALN